MAERTQVCEYCNQEVPVGQGCNQSQARDCPNNTGGAPADHGAFLDGVGGLISDDD